MSKKILGPINRVEGDLEIELDLDNDVITSARIKSTMYRGFEEMLVGRTTEDALVLNPRVCGICSITQSVATARAIADSASLEVAANGQRVINILHAAEVATDLFTHFYLFFMPDFTHVSYAGQNWFSIAKQKFTPASGQSYAEALKARARFLHIMGILGGKWPHTLAIQPGGSTKSVGLSDIIQLRNHIGEFKQFLSSQLFGCSVEQMAVIASEKELEQVFRETESGRSADLGFFYQISQKLKLAEMGTHQGGYISFGNFSGSDSHPASTDRNGSGVFIQNQKKILEPNLIIESIDKSFYNGEQSTPNTAFHFPDINKSGAYSWSKAPRYHNQVMETGAFSRGLMSNQRLAEDLMKQGSASVYSRMMMRMQELARLLLQMDQWVMEIQQGACFINDSKLPMEGQGVGLIEAARGSLGHWLAYSNGKIDHYQIIAPTTWNFSPRDSHNQPGALEQSLIGINQVENPQSVQHIIRSYDPCMQCTVH